MNVVVPGSETLDTDSIKKELEARIADGLGLDATLEGLAKDPEKKDYLQSKLMQIRADYRDFYKADGQINTEKLKEQLSWKEKLSIIVSQFLVANLLSHFFQSGKAERVEFSKARDYYKQHTDKGAHLLENGDIVWDQNDLFSQIKTFFGLTDMAAEQEDAFPLPPASRIVVNPISKRHGPTFKPTMYSVLGEYCRSKGLTLNLVQPGETLVTPGKDEIQLIFTPEDGVPLNADKATVDMTQLKWYYDLYKSGVPLQWMLTGPLLASVLVMDHVPVETALDSTHANLPTVDASFKALLESINTGGKAPEKPAAHLLPMATDGKVDKAKIEEMKKQYEAGHTDWYKPVEVAAIMVLQGADVARALEKSGIPTTDPNFATLKTDLESLKS